METRIACEGDFVEFKTLENSRFPFEALGNISRRAHVAKSGFFSK